jgi:sec-independent protein translocase protein TatB
VFGQFGWGEMLLLVVVGLFVFGPERLPSIARDAGKVIRQLRDQARTMRDDLQAELGPELAELDLKSLNPRTLVEKHLLGEDEDEAPPAVVSEIPLTPPRSPAASETGPDLTKAAPSASPLASRSKPSTGPDSTPYDDDAT